MTSLSWWCWFPPQCPPLRYQPLSLPGVPQPCTALRRTPHHHPPSLGIRTVS
ncbi:unnamed protein product [Staurois parvus]|uniref:Uncharacterized protein n=1 Tax=Staurois parvus TaxID=386267 RepID=A0ABN9GRW9_9NEOB|nr:unnamed protein product [Staurois parvus]